MANLVAPTLSSSLRYQSWIFAIVLLAYAVAPLVTHPLFLMQALCLTLFAASFNLLAGHAGLLSFGHAAFFGLAAYVSAHAAKVWAWPPEFALLGATAAAALLGLVFGVLAIRRQGIYFAMITLALAQMVYFYAVKAPWMHGEDGIQNVPQGVMFGLFDLSHQLTLYFVVLAVATAGCLFIYRVVKSPFGQVLRSIRDNENRAISLGYRVDRYKLIAFVLSAAFSGLAGAMKAIVVQLASLTDISWMTSGDAVLMTLVGGIGTVFGPVIGALVLVLIQDRLAHLGSWVMTIHGVVFVLCILVFPRGIVGGVSRLIKKPL